MEFKTERDLRRYLLKTEKGRSLLHSCMDEEMPHFLATTRGDQWVEKIQKPTRAKVLLAIHGDGYTEVYSERQVSTKAIKIPDSVTMNQSQVEACEWIATKDLSFYWQKVFQQGKVVAAFHSKPARPSDYVKLERGKHAMNLLRTMEEEMPLVIQSLEDARSAKEESLSSSTQG